jgi:predicted DNA-binding protein with PD1-like motif
MSLAFSSTNRSGSGKYYSWSSTIVWTASSYAIVGYGLYVLWQRRKTNQQAVKAVQMSPTVTAQARTIESGGISAMHTSTDGSPMRAFVLRLMPGQDLKSSLLEYVKEQGLSAAVVVTCVGSLSTATLRMANTDRNNAEEAVVTRNGRFEIVSLVGTLSTNHGCHLHCSLSDESGALWGGHCVEGMVVNTTAEVVLAECCGLSFERHYDDKTGFRELCVLCGPLKT